MRCMNGCRNGCMNGTNELEKKETKNRLRRKKKKAQNIMFLHTYEVFVDKSVKVIMA